MGEVVLDIVGLTARDASGRALVAEMDLHVSAGERVGLVGESGSGKTMALRCCMGLAPRGVSWKASRAMLCGYDLQTLSVRQRAHLLGTQVGYVPQNTAGYLHPLIRVGKQVADGMLVHGNVTRAQANQRTRELLASVGIQDPDRIMASYPDQLSGGQAQRVKIAGALACDPALILADEPTAALDAPTQAQVAAVLDKACQERGVALLMVSHVLGLVRTHCDRVMVTHAGKVVEQGPVAGVFDDPGHPYTRALLAAQPRVGQMGQARLSQIEGTMPAEGRDRAGCGFVQRCPLAQPQCRISVETARVGAHEVACNQAWHRGDASPNGAGPAGSGHDGMGLDFAGPAGAKLDFASHDGMGHDFAVPDGAGSAGAGPDADKEARGDE